MTDGQTDTSRLKPWVAEKEAPSAHLLEWARRAGVPEVAAYSAHTTPRFHAETKSFFALANNYSQVFAFNQEMGGQQALGYFIGCHAASAVA